MKKIPLLLTLLISMIWAEKLAAQTISPVDYYPMLNWDTSPYLSYRFTSANQAEGFISFRLLPPKGYNTSASEGEKYPLILVLHGAGESARMEWDNNKKVNTPYPEGDPRIDNNDHHLFYGGRQHLAAVQSGRWPGFVLFPQNFFGTWIKNNGEAQTDTYKDLQKVLELIDFLVEEMPVDPNRIYIHGLSNGAGGTWHAIYKRPKLFAAALPMSHHGDPAMAETIASIPLWVFQGELDMNPSVESTMQTVNAIREAGGNVRYTEYDSVGHNTWNLAYNEPDFFEWMLGQVKNTSSNLAPEVNAGADQVLTLPQNATTFTASASDPDGDISSYLWEQLSGPATTLGGKNTPTLELSNLSQGNYRFKVTVKDDGNLAASDQVNLTVNAAASENEPPVVDAGPDTLLTLPADSIGLQATASDPDGDISSYIWEKVAGPDASLRGEETPTLSLSSLTAGQYTLQLTVTDDKGAKATDQLTLTVKAQPTGLPDEWALLQEVTFFPNPFTNQLKLNLKAKKRGTYSLRVYSAQGQLIHQEQLEVIPPGLENHRIRLLPDALAEGNYFIRLQSANGHFNRMYTILKK